MPVYPSLDYRKYDRPDSIWPSLKEYMYRHSTLDSLNLENTEESEDVIFQKYLNKMAGRKLACDSNDSELFKKAVKALIDGKSAYLQRMNLYRLCYVLGIENTEDIEGREKSNPLQEANQLLRALHANSLSCRPLEEFLFMCSLKFHAPWSTYRKFLADFEKECSNQPVYNEADHDLGGTFLFKGLVLRNIPTAEEVPAVVKDHLKFFARRDNTHYNAIFDSGIERVEGKKRTHYRIRRVHFEENDILPHVSYITARDYYTILFGILPVDMQGSVITGAEDDQDSSFAYSAPLSEKEINTLHTIFPAAFLSYETFCEIKERERDLDPSQETYLLHILEYTEEASFNTKQSLVDACDLFLTGMNFPPLDPSFMFNALVLDVYDYMERTCDGDFSKMPHKKERFLSLLRDALRGLLEYRSRK